MKITTLILCFCVYTAFGRGQSGVAEELEKTSVEEKEPVNIKGGKKIHIAHYPYTVAIFLGNDYINTGALVEKQWVVTAAYNLVDVSSDDLTVRVGSSNAFKGHELNVTEIFLHPEYSGNWTNDMAILRLGRPAPISHTVKPIKVTKVLPKDGVKTIVTGFGGTKDHSIPQGILRKAVIPYISYKYCKPLYQAERTFTPVSFCAGKKGIGACQWDWGAPLVHKKKLIGLFSGTHNCGNTPGVYADITNRGWIVDTIRRH